MSINRPSTTFGEKRERYNISNAIYQAIKNNTVADRINNGLITNVLYNLLSRKNHLKGENEISVMDAYYYKPEELSDETINEILSGIVGDSQESEDSKKLEKLNIILDGAAEHTIRMMEESAIKYSNNKEEETNKYSRLGIGYFKNTFGELVEIYYSTIDKKYKVHFNLTSLEDCITIARKLLLPPEIKKDENGNPIVKFTLAREQKNGLFMKNILAFSDLERNKAYTSRTLIFEKTIQNIFSPILNMNTKKNKKEDKDRKSNEEPEYSQNFSLIIPKESSSKEQKINGKFIFCTKSQESIIDKIFRDGSYQSIEDLNDILRGSIIVEKHEDLIFLMHYFIKHLIRNENFNYSIFNEKDSNGKNINSGVKLEWEKFLNMIKDKGILNTTNKEWKKNLRKLPKGTPPEDGTVLENYTEENLDWIVTNILKKASQIGKRGKSTNSKNYIDTKLIIPVKIGDGDVSLPIELKFLLKNNDETNNKGLQSHEIMRLKQNILKIIRNEKYISANRIRAMIKLLLDSNQNLEEEIRQQINKMHDKSIRLVGKESTLIKTPEDYLFEIIIQNLKINKLIGEGVFFDQELRDKYKRQGALPDMQTVKRILSQEDTERKNREARMMREIRVNAQNIVDSKKEYNSDGKITRMIMDLYRAIQEKNDDKIKTIYQKIKLRIKATKLIQKIEEDERSGKTINSKVKKRKKELQEHLKNNNFKKIKNLIYNRPNLQ